MNIVLGRIAMVFGVLGVIALGTLMMSNASPIELGHGMTPPPRDFEGGWVLAHGMTPPPRDFEGGWMLAHGMTPPPREDGGWVLAHGMTPPPRDFDA